jgi:hypothetical protein
MNPILTASRMTSGQYAGGWDVSVNLVHFILRADGKVENMWGYVETDAALLKNVQAAVAAELVAA